MEFIKRGNESAIKDENGELTYNQLIDQSIAFSETLNISAGDRVVIFSENLLTFGVAMVSVWVKNATIIVVDSSSSEKEFNYIVSDCTPVMVLVSKAKEAEAEAFINKCEIKPEIVCFEGFTSDKTYDTGFDVSLENDALIIYTSGTTGEPKGVVLTFGNLYANMIGTRNGDILQENRDTLFIILPMHHIFPILVFFAGMHFRCQLIYAYKLDGESLKENLAKFQPTVFPGVPRLYESFHKGIMTKINGSKIATLLFNVAKKLPQSIRKKIFKKVHLVFGGKMSLLVSGGAKLPEYIMRDFQTLGFTIVEGYGMSECAPLIAFTRRDMKAPIGSVGTKMPVDGLDVKVSDSGEVLVKGPNVMRCYWNKPEATAAMFTSDGYLKTGDRGEFKEGNLFLSGRLKEMIVLSNGKNIDPVGIENDLLEEDKEGVIQELAVLEYNKKLLVMVYPNMHFVLSKKISNVESVIRELVNRYNAKAHGYRKIIDIKITTTELPKTRLGKVRRFQLPDMLAGKMEKKQHSEEKDPETESYQLLKKFLVDLKGSGVFPTSHIEFDLGLDSLEFLDLQSFIERTFGIHVEPSELVDKLVVKELADFIEKNKQFTTEQEINFDELISSEYTLKIPQGRLIGFAKWRSSNGLKKHSNLIIKGLENIPERNVIFSGNHQSFLDPFILFAALPLNRLQNSYFMAKHTNFNSWWKRLLGNNVNTIILDANDNVRESLQATAQVLREGKNMVIFPEGTRSTDGEIQTFKRSFAQLSEALRVPVQPFVIYGAYEAMPRTSKKLKEITYGDIVIEFLPCIESKNKTFKEILDETEGAVKTAFNRYKVDKK